MKKLIRYCVEPLSWIIYTAKHPREAINHYFTWLVPLFALIGAGSVMFLAGSAFYQGGVYVSEQVEQALQQKYGKTIIIERVKAQTIPAANGRERNDTGVIEPTNENIENTETTTENPTAYSIQDRIRRTAEAESFNDPSLLIRIAKCESSFNPIEKHQNKDGSIDHGLFQINNRWHPEVSISCSLDLECSTKEAIRIGKNRGFEREWSASKHCWDI